MLDNCKQLVESYIAWLKASISIAEVNGTCEITTPFLDRHNDQLQIYVSKQNGKLLLSDDGAIISDLETSGCPLDSPVRQQLLATILRGFGVRNEAGVLSVEAEPEDFPRKKHALLQAMMTVNDMFMTAHPRVVSLFLEDVTRFLESKQIRFSPGVEFTGKTGFVHRFDFLIPKSQREPERLVRAINHPDKNQTLLLISSWSDTREVRPAGSKLIAVLNDEERAASPEIQEALGKYEILAVPWSRRDDHVDLLAA